ncbi:hypothetical protein XENTR_v10005798 [Xenopus tropicalis]|nr:hypothetical protein XENTR_v10005798 [Xenopus tropicalis]
MNQFGASALINLSSFSSSTTTTTTPTSVAVKQEPVMANSTPVGKVPVPTAGGGRASPDANQVLTKKKLHDLVREVDPNEQLDEDVEERDSGTCGFQALVQKKFGPIKRLVLLKHINREWL